MGSIVAVTEIPVSAIGSFSSVSVLTYAHVGSIARGRRNLTSPFIGGHLLSPYSEVEAGRSKQVIEGQRSNDKSLG